MTAAITVLVKPLPGSKSGSVGWFLISMFTNAPSRPANASTSASVGIGSRGATLRVGRPPPGLPSTSVRQGRTWASVFDATSPVQAVVRSSVASWITTGTGRR